MTKTCGRCKVELPLDSFHKRSASKDGLAHRCKSCSHEVYTEWRKANPEKARANSYRQTAKLKAKNPNYHAEWEARNYATPEGRARVIANKNRRRARLMEATGEVTAEEFAELCLLYEGKCLACGRDDIRMTMDHVVPLSKGGSNTIDNIQPLCMPCNSKKSVSCTDYRPQILH